MTRPKPKQHRRPRVSFVEPPQPKPPDPNLSGARVLDQRQDTALRLLNEIKARLLDPSTLTPDQRRSCLVLLADGSMTQAELASLFRVSASLIRKDLRTIREELGREVREWSLEAVLGELAMAADRCSAMAFKQEDAGLAWTIKRDFVRALKELGVLGSETHAGVRVTIESMGESFERARQVLSQALDPMLTGEVMGSSVPMLTMALGGGGLEEPEQDQED